MTDNELIAEFMGLRSKEYLDSLRERARKDGIEDENTYVVHFLLQQNQYDTSWDWLMPVVEKIGTYTLAYPERVKEVTLCRVIINRDALYRKCVEFIKWFNNQPK